MSLPGLRRRSSLSVVSLLSLVFVTALAISGCGGSSGTTPKSITLDLTAKQIALGANGQIQVQATLANGTTEDVSSLAAYLSSNPSVATVSLTGKITAVAPGIAVITVTYQAQSATVTITITAATATALSLTATASSLAAGATTQLKANATYTDGSTADVTASATYASSSSTVATVNAAGLATGVAVGTATITATYEGQTATTTLTVTAAPVTVASLAVTPATVQLLTGATQQLKTTATKTDGTTADVTGEANYTSSAASIAAVSLTGEIIAVASGTATITATYEGKSATASVTVTAVTATAITLTSSSNSIAAGLTAQLQANATYSDTTTGNITSSATYTSSDPAAATVNASGLVTAVAIGTTTITATYEGKSATTLITVTAATAVSIVVTASSSSFAIGLTTQLHTTATLTNAATPDVTSQANYTSSVPAVATVNAAGLVTGVSAGSTVITATYEGKSATVPITVIAATVQSIALTAGSTSFANGATTQLQTTANLSNATTPDVTSQATYASSVPAVATVSASGVVTGVSIGSTVITASYQGKTATVNITISAATAISLALTSSANNLSLGKTAQLQTTATLTDGTTPDVTSSATYTSTNPSVATINASGQITAVSQGTAVVTATYEGQTATVNITVSAPVIVSITVNPSAVQLANGTTKQLQALASFTDASLADVTGTATWSTSPSVATVSASGVLTTVGTGSATVIATQTGISGTSHLTVTPTTLVGFLSLPVNPSVAAGTTLQASATGIFSDGSTQDLSNQLSFNASDPSVATVSSSGLVSGITPGTVTITAMTNANLGTMSAPASWIVTSATLDSLAVTPANVSVAQGLAQQISALGSYSDGSSEDFTQSATWASSDTSVAIINAQGTLTALNPGTATITATLIGVPTAAATVTVTNATIVSLAITPLNISLNIGESQLTKVTATLSDGTTQDVTATASLTVSVGLGNILTAPPSTAPQVRAEAVGSGTITASLDSQTGQANLTVGQSLISGVSLPSSAEVPVGSSQPSQVQAVYADGSSHLLTTNLSFASSSPATASVDGIGDMTGNQVGVSTVTGTYDNPSGTNYTASTAVTVPAANLQVLTLLARSSVNAVGVPIQLFTLGTYSDGSVLDISDQVHYASSNPAVATANNLGVVTPVGTGGTQLSAELNGVTGSRNVNIGSAVLQTIAVNAISTLAAGSVSHLSAIGTFSDASQQDISSLVSWSSSNPTVGLVAPTGDAAGVSVGTFNAVASFAGISGQATVQVAGSAAPTLTSITVTPMNVNLIGSVVSLLPTDTQYTATGNYSDGSTLDLTTVVQWSTSNGSVGAVTPQGQLIFTLQGLLGLVGQGQNSITINASYGLINGTANVVLTVL